MLTYAPEHTLSGGYLYKEWDAVPVVTLLGYMVPWNMRAILASNTDDHTARVEAAAAEAEKAAKQAKKAQKKTKQTKAADAQVATTTEGGGVARAAGGKEPWFGVAFARQRFGAESMSAWAAGTPPEAEASCVPGLSLVPPNNFIATEFTLLPRPAEGDSEAGGADTRPTRLLPPPQSSSSGLLPPPSSSSSGDGSSSVLSVWHKEDSVFRTPRATMCFRFAAAGLGGSVLASVFAALFVELIRDGFNETVREKTTPNAFSERFPKAHDQFAMTGSGQTEE
jgi:secreted Zn-dependent insulinase-like peptidase